MLRSVPSARVRRLVAAVAVVPLLLGLAACGEDGGSDLPGSGESVGDLSAVSIDGEVGEALDVTWNSQLEADGVESEVVVEGAGEPVASGDQVFSRLWIGNGFSQEEVFSGFGRKAAPEVLVIGSEQLIPAISEAVEGQPMGSRVAIAAPAADAFGEAGNAQLGIGNGDSVVFVVDLIEELPAGPSGAEQDPAGWAPEVVQEDELPSSLDFAGTPEPTDELRSTTLIQGEGEPTKKGDTIYVNYVGQVYGGEEPFDSSFARGEAFSFELGAGGVVQGWDDGLAGVPLGSRVLLAIPPDLGYGKKGNKDAGISGTDTLYFVIDVLAAV